MLNYYLFEWRQFITNKKNIGIFCIFIGLAFYYVLVSGPNYQPIEKINQPELEAKVGDRRKFVDNYRLEKDTTGHLGIANEIFLEYLAIDEPRLEALQNKNWTNYTRLTAEWYPLAIQLISSAPEGLLFYNPAYYQYGQYYPQLYASYGYYLTGLRYQSYIDQQVTITKNILEEKTALQHLQRLLEGLLPYLLLLIMILYSIDMITKDYRHSTLLFGFPLSTSRKLIVKSLVALSGLLATIVIASVIVYLGIGWQFGFGPINLTFVSYPEETTTVITFIAKNIWLISLQALLIFWLLVLPSLLVKNDFLNLVIGSLYLITDRLYYGQGKGFFVDYSQYPTSYIRTGQVLSGFENFYYGSREATYNLKNATLSVSLTLLFLVALSIVWTKRRRFRSL